MSELVVSEGSFVFNGLTLTWKEWQNRSVMQDLPVAIALHGWMDNAGTFDRLVPLLDLPRVIALDFSGHGKSSHRSRDSDYYIWSYAEEVKALLSHLGMDRCMLLAHSMGGAVASVFTGLYPECVLCQVMLDMAGPITTGSSSLLQQMRRAIEDKQEIAAQPVRHYPSLKAAQQSRANRGISLESAITLGERGIARDEQGWFWSVDRQLTRRHLLSLTEDQCESVLKANRCPTLVLTAAETWNHRKDFLQRRLSLLANLEFHELDGNHFQHLEGRTEELASLINGFLARHQSRTE